MLTEDFKQAFKMYSIVHYKREWKNSFVEKRNALNKKTYRFNFTITDEDLSEEIESQVKHEKKVVAKVTANNLFGEAAQFEEKMQTDDRFGMPKHEKNFDIESIQETTDEISQSQGTSSSESDIPVDVEDLMLCEEQGSDDDNDGDEDGSNLEFEEDEDDELQTGAETGAEQETTSSSSNSDLV